MMLIMVLLIMILWTWGLTPVWVNIVGTIFAGVSIFLRLLKLLIAIIKESKE